MVRPGRARRRVHPFDFIQDGPEVATITSQLRRRHATDSTYIRLAQQLGTTVWTLDGPLAQRGRRRPTRQADHLTQSHNPIPQRRASPRQSIGGQLLFSSSLSITGCHWGRGHR